MSKKLVDKLVKAIRNEDTITWNEWKGYCIRCKSNNLTFYGHYDDGRPVQCCDCGYNFIVENYLII
jgi:transposase-like protein